jgi:putative FmdB family regulatory protein
MPLYEYACKSCASQFEVLMRANETPECPSCRGRDLERKLSVFAAHTVGTPVRSARASACGSCGDPRGPGACSIN